MYSRADLVEVVRADIASARNTTPGRVVLLANQAELLDGFKLGASLGPCDETQSVCITVMEMPCEVTPASYGDFVDANTTGFMKVREIRFPLYHRMWRDTAGKWHPRTDAEAFETPVGVADFPPSQNIRINMMPFVLADCNSIPEEYRHYWPMIEQCKAKSAPGQIAFLTIHESDVEAGEVQRRPGLHVEAPRVLSESGEWMNRRAHWGCGLVRGDMSYVEGGMYMATNTPDSSRIWNAKILDTSRAARLDGSVEHLREHLGEGEVMEANTLYWLTDATPHEALPLPVASHRQFFRLVTGPLGTWFSQHNTENPLVPASKLSPATKVVSANKFETPSSARVDLAPSE